MEIQGTIQRTNERLGAKIFTEKNHQYFTAVSSLVIATLAFILTRMQTTFNLKSFFVLNPLLHGHGYHFVGNIILFLILLCIIQAEKRFFIHFGIAYITSIIFSCITFLKTGQHGIGLSEIISYLYTYYSLVYFAKKKPQALLLFIIAIDIGVNSFKNLTGINSWGNASHLFGILCALLTFICERRGFKCLKINTQE